MSTDEAAQRAAANGTGDPAAIEAEIVRRREHLAATVDELMVRVRPQALARQGVTGAKGTLRSAVLTPEGTLRTERVGAVAVAVVGVCLLLTVVVRRRRH